MGLDAPRFGPRSRCTFELNWTSGFGGTAEEKGDVTGWEEGVQGVLAIRILNSMSAFSLIWHWLLFEQSSIVSGRGRERRKINTFLEMRCGFCFDYFVFLQPQKYFFALGLTTKIPSRTWYRPKFQRKLLFMMLRVSKTSLIFVCFNMRTPCIVLSSFRRKFCKWLKSPQQVSFPVAMTYVILSKLMYAVFPDELVSVLIGV